MARPPHVNRLVSYPDPPPLHLDWRVGAYRLPAGGAYCTRAGVLMKDGGHSPGSGQCTGRLVAGRAGRLTWEVYFV